MKRYYSLRTGKNPNSSRLNLDMFRRLFRDCFVYFIEIYYLQEAFGYECVDAPDWRVPGSLGQDIEAQLFLKLRKEHLWPIKEKCLDYSEDDLFDIIEFLYDCVSKPVDGNYHEYQACGWHYHTFDKLSGKVEFRDRINEILPDYDEGFELTEDGQILALASPGLETLFAAPLPTYDPENVEDRVRAAMVKFRRQRSSLDDRREAIRNLADILEFMRPKLKVVLSSKDESDLFNIANNFGIRHHKLDQKTEYDKSIWYSWMFYYYLTTIHASLRLFEKYDKEKH